MLYLLGSKATLIKDNLIGTLDNFLQDLNPIEINRESQRLREDIVLFVFSQYTFRIPKDTVQTSDNSKETKHLKFDSKYSKVFAKIFSKYLHYF